MDAKPLAPEKEGVDTHSEKRRNPCSSNLGFDKPILAEPNNTKYPRLCDTKAKKAPVPSPNAIDKNWYKLSDEEFLEKAIGKKDVCHFSTCNQPTNLFNHKCTICCYIHCLSHRLPEVHGCGDEVKKLAKQKIAKLSSELKMTKIGEPNPKKNIGEKKKKKKRR